MNSSLLVAGGWARGHWSVGLQVWGREFLVFGVWITEQMPLLQDASMCVCMYIYIYIYICIYIYSLIYMYIGLTARLRASVMPPEIESALE